MNSMETRLPFQCATHFSVVNDAEIVFFIVAATIVAIALSSYYRRRRQYDTVNCHNRLAEKIDFLERAGGRYGYADCARGFIDGWRPVEFPSLIAPIQLPASHHLYKRMRSQGRRNHDCQKFISDDKACNRELEVYLDYAGSALPSRSQLERIMQTDQILANPHSRGGGLASDRTWSMMQISKECVLRHVGIQNESIGLNESDEDANDGDMMGWKDNCQGYELVFTSGATDSIRIVAERFPWSCIKLTAANSQDCYIVKDENDMTTASRSSSFELKSIQTRSILLYPKNVHTSVIGMREVALQRGCRFHCVSVEELLSATTDWFRDLLEMYTSYELCDDRLCEETKDILLDRVSAASLGDNGDEEMTTCKTIWIHHLLVLPLECNFGGDRFDWINTITNARKSHVSKYYHRSSDNCDRSTTVKICHKWQILLDIAKAAATSPVHLHSSDFAVMSFYKLFGSPTGLGVLLVKKHPRRSKTKPRMQIIDTDKWVINTEGNNNEQHICGGLTLERNIPPRHFFGGGSVDLVLPEDDYMIPRKSSSEISLNGDKDIDLGVMVHGTEHFRGIVHLVHGFQELDDVGGMSIIAQHTNCLITELVHRLRKLVHDNGKSVVQLYGQWKCFTGEEGQHPGSCAAFNICGSDGSLVGYDEVARLASLNIPPIQLRTGCFCNPGACQTAIPLSNEDVIKNYSSGHVCGDPRGILNDKPTGAIRASFGKESIWEDMDALVLFIEKVFVSRGDMILAEELKSASKFNSPYSNIPTKVDSLFVFPIKSCAAMRVNRWPMDRCSGRLTFDREFALVYTSGTAMRLHSHPKMSQIHPMIDLQSNIMTVRAPNHDDLILSLEDTGSTMSSQDVEVCGTLCKGCVFGGCMASKWFSSVLGVRCWLVRHQDKVKTERNSQDTTWGHAYSNDAPLLVVSQQSISYLNKVITTQGWGKPVEARHFRPNIVVSGVDYDSLSHPEDSWEQIIIRGNNGTVILNAVGKCARCQMVDVDPSSGMKGNTLRALAQYRRDQGRINFGTYFIGVSDAYVGDMNFWMIEEGDIVDASSKNKIDCIM